MSDNPDQVLHLMTTLAIGLVVAASLHLAMSYAIAGLRWRMWRHLPALAPLAAVCAGWSMALLAFDTITRGYLSWYLVATLACVAVLGAVGCSLQTVETLPPIFDAGRPAEEDWMLHAGVRRAMLALRCAFLAAGVGVIACVAMAVGCEPGSTPWTCTVPTESGVEGGASDERPNNLDPHFRDFHGGDRLDPQGREPGARPGVPERQQQGVRKRRPGPVA